MNFKVDPELLQQPDGNLVVMWFRKLGYRYYCTLYKIKWVFFFILSDAKMSVMLVSMDWLLTQAESESQQDVSRASLMLQHQGQEHVAPKQKWHKDGFFFPRCMTTLVKEHDNVNISQWCAYLYLIVTSGGILVPPPPLNRSLQLVKMQKFSICCDGVNCPLHFLLTDVLNNFHLLH